jgi:aspartate/methionine/tyrosine aminotransferase
MYEHLVYDGVKPTCIATLSKEAEARTITVAGFSKTYAMTGWRIGTTLAPAPPSSAQPTAPETAPVVWPGTATPPAAAAAAAAWEGGGGWAGVIVFDAVS